MAKTISAENFVPGRIYSLIYKSEVEMVGKRKLDVMQTDKICDFECDGAFVLNPLADCLVTVRRVSTVQAAGNETWTNFLAKSGEEPSGNRKSWYKVSDANDCIVIGTSENTQGQVYLRGLPRGITKEEDFVGGQPASLAQVETIRAFKRSKGECEFVIMNLDKLENVASLEVSTTKPLNPLGWMETT